MNASAKRSLFKIGGTVLGGVGTALTGNPMLLSAGMSLGNAAAKVHDDPAKLQNNLQLGLGDPNAGYEQGLLGKDYTFVPTMVGPRQSGLETATDIGMEAAKLGTEAYMGMNKTNPTDEENAATATNIGTSKPFGLYKPFGQTGSPTSPFGGLDNSIQKGPQYIFNKLGSH